MLPPSHPPPQKKKKKTASHMKSRRFRKCQAFQNFQRFQSSAIFGIAKNRTKNLVSEDVGMLASFRNLDLLALPKFVPELSLLCFAQGSRKAGSPSPPLVRAAPSIILIRWALLYWGLCPERVGPRVWPPKVPMRNTPLPDGNSRAAFHGRQLRWRASALCATV